MLCLDSSSILKNHVECKKTEYLRHSTQIQCFAKEITAEPNLKDERAKAFKSLFEAAYVSIINLELKSHLKTVWNYFHLS